MLELTSLHMQLPAESGAPEMVHLIPAGVFSGADGRGPYELTDVDGVIRASMAEGKLVIDENHSTDRAMLHGGSAPAAGWIVELQSRDNGIWGRVDWTGAGHRLMTDRAYRGMSPAFTAREGKVKCLMRASLTNTPNLPVMHLHSKETRMDLARVRSLLGLSDTATEADVERALTAARGRAELHSRVAEIAGLTNGTSEAELVTALRAKVSGAGATVIELQSQIAELRAAGQREKAEAFVDGAIRDGRAIDTVLRGELIELHATKPDAVKRIIEGMPNLKRQHSFPAGGPTRPVGEHTASVASALGLDPAKLSAVVGSAG